MLLVSNSLFIAGRKGNIGLWTGIYYGDYPIFRILLLGSTFMFTLFSDFCRNICDRISGL